MASLLSLFRTKPKSMPEATAVTTEKVERFLAKYDRSQDCHLDEYELRAAFEDTFPAGELSVHSMWLISLRTWTGILVSLS